MRSCCERILIRISRAGGAGGSDGFAGLGGLGGSGRPGAISLSNLTQALIGYNSFVHLFVLCTEALVPTEACLQHTVSAKTLLLYADASEFIDINANERYCIGYLPELKSTGLGAPRIFSMPYPVRWLWLGQPQRLRITTSAWRD